MTYDLIYSKRFSTLEQDEKMQSLKDAWRHDFSYTVNDQHRPGENRAARRARLRKERKQAK